MTIKINKEGTIEFETVEEAVQYQKEMNGMIGMKPKTLSALKAVRSSIEQDEEDAYEGPADKSAQKFEGIGRYTEKEKNFIIEFYRRNSINGMLKRGKMVELVTTMGRSDKALAKLATELRKSGLLEGGYLNNEKEKSEQTVPSYKVRRHLKQWASKEDAKIIEAYKKYKSSKGKNRMPTKKLKVLANSLGRTTLAVKIRALSLKKDIDK